MKILNKFRDWFFDKETDKEEEWEVPFSKGGDANERYNKAIDDFESFEAPDTSQIKKHTELTRKWQQEFLNDCFGVIENDESDYTHKIKYYKRKVKIFHGLQGFKWEYEYSEAKYDAVMKCCGYIEITKEEYEENAK